MQKAKTRKTKSVRKQTLIGIVLFLAVIGGGYFVLKNTSVQKPSTTTQQQSDRPRVVYNGQEINIEIANTPDSRERGLSNRELMDKGQGILFAFEDAGPQCMWMKDMHFSIDILWIRENGIVVRLAEDVAPSTYPDKKFCSDTENVRYVLELVAGTSRELGISPGSTLQIVR